MPVLLNMVGQPYSNADAVWYLKTLKDGGFDAMTPVTKFSTTTGINKTGGQKPLDQVLAQKKELSDNIKASYDEHKRAGGTQDALFELGRFVAFKTGGVFVPGPLKGWDGVIRKTMDFDKGGYKGDYAQIKDEVRITIVGGSMKIYKDVCQFMNLFCRDLNKMSLRKFNTRDPNTDTCGYSDTNIVVTLPNGQPGEVQVNNRAVLYGKMSRETYCRDLGVGNDEYMTLSMGYGIEGGLGHAFYEIYDRVSKGKPNGSTAAKLSKRYYDTLRAHPVVNVAERKKLMAEINTFKALPENAHTFAH